MNKEIPEVIEQDVFGGKETSKAEKVKPKPVQLWTLKCGCVIYDNGEAFVVNEFCPVDSIRAVAAQYGVKPSEEADE